MRDFPASMIAPVPDSRDCEPWTCNKYQTCVRTYPHAWIISAILSEYKRENPCTSPGITIALHLARLFVLGRDESSPIFLRLWNAWALTIMSTARWLIFYPECVVLAYYYNLYNPNFLALYGPSGCSHSADFCLFLSEYILFSDWWYFLLWFECFLIPKSRFCHLMS